MGREGAGNVDHIYKIARVACRSSVVDSRPDPVLMGKHLIARGMEPGPQVGRMLETIYNLQLDDPEYDLAKALDHLDEIDYGERELIDD